MVFRAHLNLVDKIHGKSCCVISSTPCQMPTCSINIGRRSLNGCMPFFSFYPQVIKCRANKKNSGWANVVFKSDATSARGFGFFIVVDGQFVLILIFKKSSSNSLFSEINPGYFFPSGTYHTTCTITYYFFTLYIIEELRTTFNYPSMQLKYSIAIMCDFRFKDILLSP